MLAMSPLAPLSNDPCVIPGSYTCSLRYWPAFRVARYGPEHLQPVVP